CVVVYSRGMNEISGMEAILHPSFAWSLTNRGHTNCFLLRPTESRSLPNSPLLRWPFCKILKIN
ncbi:MAG: hypothetical protein WAZ77_15100, partial [Candidatus Nitrosopolaris sp.]